MPDGRGVDFHPFQEGILDEILGDVDPAKHIVGQ
jgi:hypothetical protein